MGTRNADYCNSLQRVITFLVGVFLIVFGTATATPGKKAEEGLSVRVGETVEISSSMRFCWYPTVHRFPTGEIMVTMRMSPDEMDPEGNFSGYCISRDGGLTWSKRYPMGSGADVDGAWSESPQNDGAVWNLWGYAEPHPEGQAEELYLTLTKYTRGGMEFTQVRDVPLRLAQPLLMAPVELFDRHPIISAYWPPGPTNMDGRLTKYPELCPFGPILKGQNGDLMAPAELTTANSQNGVRHGSQIGLLRSSDGGKSWKEYSTIAASDHERWPWMGTEGPDESALVRLADNRLCSIFRTGEDGYMGQAWSSDDGRTWTSPTSMAYQGVCPRARRLSNGVLALTTGRPGPIVIMFSIDGTGQKWSQTTPIFSKADGARWYATSTHYTDFIEVEPGKLFVVYDSVPYGWHAIPYSERERKNTVYGTFVYVQKE